MQHKVWGLLCSALLLCSAPLGWAKVHEVLWDVPADGLQLPSISTAKCGDTIRFRCPLHATHGLFKMEETNYNGTCPQSFEAPMVGEALFQPKKACDFSITLEEGPDFYITSNVPGACQKNMKVYIHAVCIKAAESNFVSGLFNSLPAMPSLPSFRSGVSRRAAAAEQPAAAAAAPQLPSLPAAGYAGVVAGDVPFMGGADAPTLGASPQLRPASRMSAGPSGPVVLEAAKQSGAPDMRPAVASLMLAVAAVALML